MQNYNGQSMFYDWSLPLNDSSFQVPDHLSARVTAEWSFWKVIKTNFLRRLIDIFFSHSSLVMEFSRTNKKLLAINSSTSRKW